MQGKNSKTTAHETRSDQNYIIAYNYDKLHVAYITVFRLLLNQTRYCSASNIFVKGVKGAKAVIRNRIYKFMLRLGASCNKLVIAIFKSDLKKQSRIRRHRIKILYINYSLN